jgi:hypothetical protein
MIGITALCWGFGSFSSRYMETAYCICKPRVSEFSILAVTALFASRGIGMKKLTLCIHPRGLHMGPAGYARESTLRLATISYGCCMDVWTTHTVCSTAAPPHRKHSASTAQQFNLVDPTNGIDSSGEYTLVFLLLGVPRSFVSSSPILRSDFRSFPYGGDAFARDGFTYGFTYGFT